MTQLKTMLLASATALVMCGSALAADMTVGFSQIGSESGWRAAETSVTKLEAEKRGVDLKFADAQQKQENQIKAIRGFIAQGVDAIMVAPVVATGWDSVLQEAKEAEIPVILLDRGIDGSPDLYMTMVASDQVLEGKVAGDWLVKDAAGKECNVVELQGTTGSTPAINRKKGFIKAEGGGKNICALYAHNDDMAVGAIQAIKEAGLKPGTDIKVVSIDAVPDIFKAMADGEANATVELTPNMAGPAFDALEKFMKDGTLPPKQIITESKLYTPADDPMKVYEEKKGLGY
jgi:ABC-type sugar transport system substrate-binding protein